jgi:hypothetical protein
MTQQRIDPLGLIAASTKGAALTASAAHKETARQNNTQLGACPVCQKAMQLANAGGHPVYVCMDHAVCLPTQS